MKVTDVTRKAWTLNIDDKIKVKDTHLVSRSTRLVKDS